MSKHKALNSCCSGPTGAHPQPASSGSSASTKVVDSGGGLSVTCSKHGTTYSWGSSSNDLGNQSLKPQPLLLWPSPSGLSLKGTTCFLFHVSESLKQRLYFNFSTLCLKSYELVSYMSSHLQGGCVWSLHHTAGSKMAPRVEGDVHPCAAPPRISSGAEHSGWVDIFEIHHRGQEEHLFIAFTGHYTPTQTGC